MDKSAGLSVGKCEICGDVVVDSPDGMGKFYCSEHKQEVVDL